MKIETNEDFLKWNNAVNHSTVKTLCNLQDVWARSDQKHLLNLFLEQTKNDKNLSVFAIQKAMGSEQLMVFIRAYARHKATEYIDSESAEMDERFNRLAKAEMEFRSEKERLAADIENYEDSINRLTYEVKELRIQKEKNYRRINELSDENAELTTELERLQVFEAHIKGLLSDRVEPGNLVVQSV